MTNQANSVRWLPIGEVRPGPNIRRDVGDVGELAESIAVHGIVEPLVVVAVNGDDGPWEVVAGHRRLAAAAQAGMDEVPALVRDLEDDAERLELQLVENLQRADLDPVEEAGAYGQLRELGVKQADIARRVGRSQAHVSKRLALLKLPDEVRAALDSGGITIEDAVELTKLAAHPARLDAAFSRARAYGSAVRHQVARQLDEVECDKQAERSRAEAAEMGVELLENTQGAWRDYSQVIDGDEDKPDAAFVDRRGRLVLLRRRPDRDRAASDAARAGEIEQRRAREQAEREELARASTARRNRVRDHLARAKPSKADALRLLVGAVADSDRFLDDDNLLETVAELVGVPLPDVDEDPGASWEALVDEVRGYLSGPDANVARFAVAAAAALVETSGALSPYRQSWAGPVADRHFEWLRDIGHVPCDAERARLDPPQPEPDDDAELVDDDGESES